MCETTNCGRYFPASSAEMLFCPECRKAILQREAASMHSAASNKEALLTSEYWEILRGFYDWQVVDERGGTVWASVLAKRYRGETSPRPIRSSAKY